MWSGDSPTDYLAACFDVLVTDKTINHQDISACGCASIYI